MLLEEFARSLHHYFKFYAIPDSQKFADMLNWKNYGFNFAVLFYFIYLDEAHKNLKESSAHKIKCLESAVAACLIMQG
jgi:hypothetical protein